MTVNNIKLAIGQRWLTRGGEEVEVVNNDDHITYPWDLSNGVSVTNEGQEWEHRKDSDDLITLIQDEHGFIPWNGGECPVGEDVKVDYKNKNHITTYSDVAGDLRWDVSNRGTDIIAYRVVKQEVEHAKVDADGEQTKEVVVETKTEVKEEPKYTVDQVFFAINEATADSVAYTNTNKVKSYLAKTQDPDYKLYLELKAKFEKE